MFVRRSPILASDKPQPAVLLVKELLVEGSPDGRGSESNLLPQETRVIHQTLADLSQPPPDLITHIERYCAAAADAEPLLTNFPEIDSKGAAAAGCPFSFAGCGSLIMEKCLP